MSRYADAKRAFERVTRFDPSHAGALERLESLPAEVG
jgi:hypothetical protein